MSSVLRTTGGKGAACACRHLALRGFSTTSRGGSKKPAEVQVGAKDFSTQSTGANDIRLVLMRHGESHWNKANRFTGWSDVGLTSDGEAEAAKVKSAP